MKRSLTLLAATSAALALMPMGAGQAAFGKPGTILSFSAGWSDSSHTSVFVEADWADTRRTIAMAYLGRGGAPVSSTGSIVTANLCSTYTEYDFHQLNRLLAVSECGARTGDVYVSVVTRRYDQRSGGYTAVAWQTSAPLTP